MPSLKPGTNTLTKTTGALGTAALGFFADIESRVGQYQIKRMQSHSFILQQVSFIPRVCAWI